MDSREKARRRAERQYVRRTVRLSAIAAGILLLIAFMFSARYPLMKVRQVEGLIRAGEYDQALTAIGDMQDRDAADRLARAARLAMARDQMNAGDYEAARAALLALGDYQDAPQLAQECAWRQSEALFAAGDYAGARQMNLLIPDYPGVAERNREIQYIEAGLASENDKATAFALYRQLGDYKDAASLAAALAMELTGEPDEAAALAAMEAMTEEELALAAARERMRPGAVQAGGWHTVGLTRDGRVLAVGRNDEGQCDVDAWRNVAQIGAGALHTVGLLADGTVVAAGSNEQGQCDVSAWRDVVEIACGDYATFARFSDGTVAATGYLSYDGMAAWRGVTKLCAGAYMAAGLYGSGSAYATHPAAGAAGFSGLVDLALTTGGAAGLTDTGEVTAAFPGFPGWRDMVQISAGNHCLLGIRADGRVLAHFFRYTDAVDTARFSDAVCVSAGGAHSVILDGEGRVYAFGSNEYGQCDVSGWNLD